MKKLLIATAFVGVGLWTNVGCAQNAGSANASANAQANMKKEAVAHVEPTTKGKAKGTVTFTQQADGKIKVVANIEGLTPNQKHGFHVHEGTECGEDGMKAGGHFNPGKHSHGKPGDPHDKRHAGDFGNLQANERGVAKLELTVDGITLGGNEPNNVVGRTVIVHAKEDDFGQPTGNAGDRIGCAIIRMAGDPAHAGHTTEKK